ncbi:MAG: hypothetical protein K0S76_2289 [Herbinix sp.]|jgi:hypothetical protein|nr:hypothetical protein [Herbinix sp.]
MIIAFWSPIHGQAGTTSNILTTAMIAGLFYKKKSLLTQTHFNFNNLEAPLVGSNLKNTSSNDFFRDVGLDALIRSFKAAKLNKEILDNCCISFPNMNVSLLPGTSKRNKESFEFDMDMVLINLLRTVETMTDLLFVDISSGNNALSFKIITEADLTVINLSQNVGIIDSYFQTFENQIPGKHFFLFGNYDDNSKYNINNIRRRYLKFITPLNSGVIPYNTAFLDAQCDGRVTDYFRENIGSGKNDPNYYFIQRASKSASKIIKFAGQNTILEERI